MKTGATSYYSLLAILRQEELLEEAARLQQVRQHAARRTRRILGLSLPRLRRHS